MEREEHKERATEFVASTESEFPASGVPPLNDALYTFSELGLLKSDVEIKDAETAIRIWAVVEKVRRAGFPKELRM